MQECKFDYPYFSLTTSLEINQQAWISFNMEAESLLPFEVSFHQH